MKKENILISAKDIELKYHIPYSTTMKAKREGIIKGVKIGSKILFDEERIIKPWLGLEPSNDEIIGLKVENEKLKNQVNIYKNQYKMIKQLLETLNGTVNLI